MRTDLFLSGSKMLVRVEGRFVLDECDTLKEAVATALTPSVSHLMIDLSKTDFVDSAGLGTLVGFKMKAGKTKARVTLLAPSPPVQDVLEMSKLSEIFEIASGNEAAKLAGDLDKSANLVRTIGTPVEAVSPAVQPAENLRIEEQKPKPKGPDTGELVEELCRSAVEALRRGNYEESIRFYRQALEMDSDYLPARNNLAIVYEKRPEWRENAIEQWEMVMRLSDKLGDSKHRERAEKHLQALRG